MDLEELRDLINEVVNSQKELFVIDYDISSANDIRVVIDGDRPINIDDCRYVNRLLEKKLDELEVDASVQVSSPGVDEPLKLKRQFYKNIGRKMTIESSGQVYKANLEAVNESNILLKWKAREKKKTGKGKVTIEKNKTLAFEDIEKAIVMINFNKK